MLQAEATRIQKTRGWRDVEREGFSPCCLRFVSLLFVCLLSPEGLSVVPGRACHMLPWGARVTCNPFSLETATPEVRTRTGSATL